MPTLMIGYIPIMVTKDEYVQLLGRLITNASPLLMMIRSCVYGMRLLGRTCFAAKVILGLSIHFRGRQMGNFLPLPVTTIPCVSGKPCKFNSKQTFTQSILTIGRDPSNLAAFIVQKRLANIIAC